MCGWRSITTVCEQRAQGIGIRDALLLEHAGRKRRRCVVMQHGAPQLQHHGPLVILSIDQMHGAPRFALTRRQDRLVDTMPEHAQPSMSWQECRVDIDDSPLVGGWDIKQFEIAGKHHPRDSFRSERLLQHVSGNRPLEDLGRETPFPCPRRAEALSRGDHQSDPGIQAPCINFVGEMAQRPAAP